MEEKSCPRCKTTQYRNPQLKLMVNVCGHSLCDKCVELIFLKGAANCAECGTILRRSDFRLQLFEDASVEKEVDIRRRILREYNKREDDFNSLLEFNDYLEEIEHIILNLANGIDVTETKKKIEVYKRENKEQIVRNKTKYRRDDAELDEIIEMEKHIEDVTKQQQIKEEKQVKKAKIKNKEELLDELTFSSMSAEEIMASHNSKLEEIVPDEIVTRPPPVTKFSSGINIHSSTSFISLPTVKEETYRYCERIVDYIGPNPPALEELEPEGYSKHIRKTTKEERAGGFVTDISCHRALQEAFSGLYFCT